MLPLQHLKQPTLGSSLNDLRIILSLPFSTNQNLCFLNTAGRSYNNNKMLVLLNALQAFSVCFLMTAETKNQILCTYCIIIHSLYKTDTLNECSNFSGRISSANDWFIKMSFECFRCLKVIVYQNG